MELSASLEDYLEAIFWIASRKGAARTRDITQRLGVKAASVTGALQSLTEKNLINYAPYEVITLTSKGLEAARDIIRRHSTLKDFFVGVLGVDEATADEGACRMEHAIPAQIIEKMAEFMEKHKENHSMEEPNI